MLIKIHLKDHPEYDLKNQLIFIHKYLIYVKLN